MSDASGFSSGSKKGPVSRRQALGGIVAAVAAPALLQYPAAAGLPRAPVARLPRVRPIPRQQHSMTTFNDGSAVVAGGFSLGPLSSVQLFIPNRGWFELPPLLVPRYDHAAAQLSDGRILVCGGLGEGLLSHAEIFDGATWTETAPMNIPRHGHAASPFQGGVLAAGGESLKAIIMGSAEYFTVTPAGAIWTPLDDPGGVG